MVAHSRDAGPVRTAGRVNEPRLALVESHADGSPKYVNREGVALVREEWRVVDRWWTEEPLSRRYFDVVLESGQQTVVYFDAERGTWLTQRGA
jgi:general stress protein 26